MRIYVAGPYSKGDVAVNVHMAIQIANKLAEMGHICYVPHLTHFWHLLTPKPYEYWLEYDKEFIRNWSEAVYRIPGESSGADGEVQLATAFKQIIFYSLDDVPTEPTVEKIRYLPARAKYPIYLNEYQIANLKAALTACYNGDSPLKVLNTGDWLGEIEYMLPQVEREPNASKAELIAHANAEAKMER